MMHGMRAHQSMSAMRAALNNQKQNAGIFNNNVQKRQVADVIAITVVVKETVGIIGIVQNICAAGALAGLAHRGPHWDLIDRKGRHVGNVLPGGRVC